MKNELVIIIGGTYLSEDDIKVYDIYGKGEINVSNIEFERKLIKGLEDNKSDYLFVSAPNVGIWPKSSKKFHVSNFSKTKNFQPIKYFNIYGYSHMSKVLHFNSFFRKKMPFLREYKIISIIIPEMHLPYLKCLAYLKKKLNSTFSTLIALDLPSDMNKSKNIFYKILKKRNVRFITKYVNEYIDSFFCLTDFLNRKVNKNNKPFLIREGIVNDMKLYLPAKQKNDKKCHCVFIGKLTTNNGIKLLIDAANQCANENIVFDIYGTGELHNFVVDASKKNKKINFFGFVSPNDAMQVMLNADVLLSPRIPGEEYQKYSFPSKILDYLSAKKPIVTFDILSYNDEIRKYLYFPKEVSAMSFLNCIHDVLNKNTNIKNMDLAIYYPKNIIKDILKMKVLQ